MFGKDEQVVIRWNANPSLEDDTGGNGAKTVCVEWSGT